VDSWTASMLAHLRQLAMVEIRANDPAAILRTVPPVRRLRLYRDFHTWSPTAGDLDLGVLAGRTELEELTTDFPVHPQTLPATLTALKYLSMWNTSRQPGRTDLSWLARFPELTVLNLDAITRPRSFGPLAALRKLADLTLSSDDNRRAFSDVGFLRQLPALDGLGLNGCTDPHVFERVAEAQPSLKTLQLMRLRIPAASLAPIASLPLTDLDLDRFGGILDLEPLAGHPTLRSIDIRFCRWRDLSPLASIPNLKTLYVYSDREVDLAPFAGRRLTVWASPDQVPRDVAGIRVR
jgi:hypothetical protein